MNTVPSRLARISPRLRALAVTTTAIAVATAMGASTAAAKKSYDDATQNGGGYSTPPEPTVSDVQCWQDGGASCFDAREVRLGQKVRVIGSNFVPGAQVIFVKVKGKAAGKNSGTSVSAKPIAQQPIELTATTIDVPAPKQAGRYQILIENPADRKSEASSQLLIVERPLKLSTSTGPRVVNAVTRLKVVGDGSTQSFVFELAARKGRAQVKVDLVKAGTGEEVRSWDLGQVPTNRPHFVSWNGKMGGTAKQNEGRYRFILTATDDRGRTVTASAARDGKIIKSGKSSDFNLVQNVYPLQINPKKVMLGDCLGAGRNHEGCDLIVPAGTSILASEGGVVVENNGGGAAGNHVIIKGTSGRFFIYMHMIELSPVKKGTTVKTGESIGRVGCSGRCTGDHLHFEIRAKSNGISWNAEVLDPLPYLKAWAKQ